MTKSFWRAPLLALGITVLGFAQAGTPPTKVGIINIQNAILQTKDGQQAAQEIDKKFGPRRKEFEKRQQEMQQLETQYRNGANTMAEDARQKLMRDLDTKRKQLQRDMDDAQADLEQEQGRLLQGLGQRMMTVIDKYASERGFALILDVSNPQTPVLYASNTIDITRDVVALYDKGAALQPASGAAGAPAAPPAAAPKPAAPPKK
ncbi:MAG TPA: OmpH family outer membrane protein [Bryobacteraceae bacterium]|nr:OmpH family outer membrane protein [Bryobacteraceae bacterium]